MTGPMNDDQMLTLLAESLGPDQAPTGAVEAAYAAYGWRTIDADLAKLIDDSQVEVVGFGQAPYSRLLTYDSAAGTIEVAIGDDAFEVVAVPRPQGVTVRRPGGSSDLDVDEGGRATGSGSSGPIRFEVIWPGGSVSTPWITL